MKRVCYVVNSDWFFLSHRLELALEAKNRGWEVYVLTKHSNKREIILSHGFKYIEVDFQRSGTNPLKDLFIIFHLFRVYRKIKPEVVHHVTIKPAIYGTIAAKLAAIKGLKVVNAISGLGYNFINDRQSLTQRVVNQLMKFAFGDRKANFIFQNPDDLTFYNERGFLSPGNHVLIKGAGVDAVKNLYQAPVKKSKLRVILPARMLYDKGVMEFMHAAHLLRNDFFGKVEFVMFGGIDLGNPTAIPEAEIRALEIENYLIWKGHSDNMLIEQSNADIICLPSYREGLPRALVEGMAVGRPIVTTDTAGCRECVDEGVNGFLVPIKSVNELADALRHLCIDEALRLKMGKASREKMVKEFSSEHVLDLTFKCYESAQILANKKEENRGHVPLVTKRIAFVANSSLSMFFFRKGILKELLDKKFEVHVIAPEDYMTQELIKIGVKYHPITLDSKTMNPMRELLTHYRFYTYYKRIQPDFIFHYTIKPNIYGTLSAKLLGIKSIAVVTGLGYAFMTENWLNKLVKKMYWVAFKQAVSVWFLNEDDMALFVNSGIISKEKAFLLPSEGVNLKEFNMLKRPSPSKPFRFLLVARMLWDKGVGEFVEAAKIIRAEYKEVEFQLLGPTDSENLASIGKAQIEAWVADGLVSYLGISSDVRVEIEQADCIVLPSYREGISKILMEAGAMGKPLIASNVVGCKEIIQDGYNGYLCEAMNARDLANKCIKMMNLSTEERLQMGINSRDYIAERFDEQMIIRIYSDCIEKHLNA